MSDFSVSRLTRTCGGRRLPDSVSFTVAKGELVAVTGPSGSGKSALLRCIAGLDTPESGVVSRGGVSWSAMPAHLRPVAYVAQGAALWPQMTVRANLAFGPESAGVPSAEVRARVDVALSEVGVEGLAERRPSTLSGGEQARVALARVLARRAEVVLCDEPFAWLEAGERETMIGVLRAQVARTGGCAIIATRDPGVIAACDRVIVLEAGGVVQTDSPDAVWRRPASVAAALCLGPANLIEATVVRCGAGEFLANSALGEWRGALGSPEVEPEEGAAITVMVRPEHWRLSPMPPDENAFPGAREVVSAMRSLTRFRTMSGQVLSIREGAVALCESEDADSPLYAWVMPEDVVGLSR